MPNTQEHVMPRGNIMPAEKFNSPTVYLDENDRPCFVHDPRSWRNKNKRSNRKEENHPAPAPAKPKVTRINPYA